MSEEFRGPSLEGPSSNEDINALLVQGLQGCALLLVDVEGHILVANPAIESITGYTSQELQGVSYACFFPKVDQLSKVPFRAMARAVSKGYYEADGWLHRKDGSTLWANLSLSPVYDDDHDLYGYTVLIRDISEKLAAEHALFNSEQQFRILVQSVRDYAIYMLDLQGRVTNWNAGAALIKGYSAEEIIGRHYSTFYTEEDRQRGEPQRGLDTALRDNTFQNEAWRVRKDGTHFWASVVIDPIYDESGDLLGFAKITRDITNKKRDEERNTRQRDTLHQSQKLEALGRLTGSVAHDFNNMLSVIRTAAELLDSDKPLARDRKRYISMITKTSERAAGLTSQLLAFARQQPLQPEVFNPADRIQGLAYVMETTLGSRNTLVLDLDTDLANVESDISQFETAILNLVINARDAMSQGGTVTIKVRNVVAALEDEDKPQDWVMIEVGDNGSGIAPETLSKIFEPFFTTKAGTAGTGLGLSQVYGYVKQSGGDIKVESELNQGTCFTLHLPPAKTPVDDSWHGLLTTAAKQDLSDRLLENGPTADEA